MDTGVREGAGISSTNEYLFPSLHSEDPVTGASELRQTCNSLSVKINVKATLIRHYVATMLPKQYNLDKNEKDVYLQHFGHSEDIHKQVYQCPEAEIEKDICSKIRKVLRHGSSNQEHLNTRVSAITDSCSDTDEEYIPDINIDLNRNITPKRTRSNKMWAKEDTELIKNYFKTYIYCEEEIRPNKKEIMRFLKKTQSKLERKTDHSAVESILRKLSNEKKLAKEKNTRVVKSLFN